MGLADEMGQWEIHELRGLASTLMSEVFGYSRLVQQSSNDSTEQRFATAATALWERCQQDLQNFETNRLRALRDPEFRHRRPP